MSDGWVLTSNPYKLRPKRERRKVLRMLRKGQIRYVTKEDKENVVRALMSGVVGSFVGIQVMGGKR